MNYMKSFKIGQSKSELLVSLCRGNTKKTNMVLFNDFAWATLQGFL